MLLAETRLPASNTAQLYEPECLWIVSTESAYNYRRKKKLYAKNSTYEVKS